MAEAGAWMLEEADGYHFQWTIICPACSSELSGVIPKDGWLQSDPVCPKCQHTIAGFTNPQWLPEWHAKVSSWHDKEVTSIPTLTGIWDGFVEFVMRLCCSVLDFINAALCWILAVVGGYDGEMRCG